MIQKADELSLALCHLAAVMDVCLEQKINSYCVLIYANISCWEFYSIL
jgi:hypothetical protein